MIKKFFTTGIAILLPVILTLMIVMFLVNFFTTPFMTCVENALSQTSLIQAHFLFLDGEEIVTIVSKLLILSGIISFILLIGVIGKLFLIDLLFNIGDRLIHNLPIINKLYKACQDVVHSLFSPTSKSFSQVVLVPFPSKDALGIGLVTKDTIILHQDGKIIELIPVFVPGTPNPTVGFILMYQKEELHTTDLKIDEAMKFIISCGVVMPEFKVNIKPSLDEPKNI